MSLIRDLFSSLFRRPNARRRRRTHQQEIAWIELLENRALMSANPVVASSLNVEPIDGVGNNLQHAQWGSAGTDLLRTAAAQYADGKSAPAGNDRPSPRLISDTLSDQSGQDIISDRQMSAMVYAWGQFIDHDIDLTPTAGTESLKIAVPKGDPWFDPAGTGTKTIDTTRSVFDSSTGTSSTNPRQQINTITAYIDGSMIYGSDAKTAASLRTFEGGHLKMSNGGLLPINNAQTFPNGTLNMANDAHLVANDKLFAAGDVRANENIELLSLQTLFVREHNRIADQIAAGNHALSDEQIFQQARSRVIAEIQSITYNEWLPALLGPNALPAYHGYNPQTNPGIANEFSTAAFRFGHSLLGNDVEFLDNNGQPVRGSVSLSQAFFNPTLVSQNNIDPILKYLASDPSSEVDLKVVDSVRNFLFGPPGSGGLDLASLNIARGRDHGLADYNTTRAAYGLRRVTSFAQITSDPTVQAKLQSLYGSVDKIDLWVGALAENHVAGGSVGATLRAIIADQFTRLRDGDRFWYQNTLSGSELQKIDHITLTDVIRANTSLSNLQNNTFFFRSSISGTVVADAPPPGTNPVGQVAVKSGGGATPGPVKRQGVAGQTVQLVDRTSGEVVAEAVTDQQGHYRFGVADGLRTGQYQIRLASDANQTGVVTPTIAITRGDQVVAGIDLRIPNSNGNPPLSKPAGGAKRNNGSPVLSNTTDTNLSHAVQVSDTVTQTASVKPKRGTK